MKNEVIVHQKMFKDFAPVTLFAYNRLDALKKTINALKKNTLAKQTDLFIFSDGPKYLKDENNVELVRNFLNGISGFKSVKVFQSKKNKGLANSIIDGVSKILHTHGQVIVLEDDLITSPNFLNFMNHCLIHFKDKPEIFSISGYSPPIKSKEYPFDVYFIPRNSSHGWATWNDRWQQVDWEVSDYQDFILDKKRKAQFNVGGSDLSNMLKKQMEGKINSWSIRFCYHQFKLKAYTVFPTVSKVTNIGFGKEATHTINYNRFKTKIDQSNKLYFEFPVKIEIEKDMMIKFQKIHSINARALGKLKTFFSRIGLLNNK